MILRHLRQNAVAYLALVVALSTGSAYAADRIANGSVTTKKLANNAVTSTKLKNNSVRTIDIKTGTVSSDDIGTNAVTSSEIANSSVTTTDVQEGTLLSGDVRDGTLTRADVKDGAVPKDADVYVRNLGAGNPPASVVPPTGASGLSSVQFTVPRTNKVAVELFVGELGVDCTGGGQGQVGIYVDGVPEPGTLVDVPAGADAGAVLIAMTRVFSAGVHTLSTSELCASGTYGPTVPAERVTWTMHVLSR